MPRNPTGPSRDAADTTDIRLLEPSAVCHDFTPLISVTAWLRGRPHQLGLKMESTNQYGSIKDRTARGLLNALESSAALRGGETVVESTSGNLGIALAAMCQERDYRFIAVVDPNTSRDAIALMLEHGAQVEIACESDKHGSYLSARLHRVRELLRRPGHFWTNQYGNPANPEVHFLQTGPEIWEQTGGACDVVFVPVSTGGTLAGIGRFLRDVNSGTHIHGVDLVGSVVFEEVPGLRRIPGIGSSRKSDFLRPEHYDSYTLISDAELVDHCRALAAGTNLRVGGSSGAALAACTRYLLGHPDCANIVCLCPDDGRKYADEIYAGCANNNEWSSTTRDGVRYE